MEQKELIFDLSASGGLAPKFFGDLNDVTSVPSLRYIGNDNQYADGIFNPLRLHGYMSPANNSYLALTGTITSLLTSTAYDSINDDAYWSGGTEILKLDGFADTSLTSVLTITGGTISNLNIYEINGERKLFYVHKAPTAIDDFIMETNFSSAVNSVQIGGRIKPAGSADPTLSASARATESGSDSTISTSITVPAGSNQTGFVIVFAYDDDFNINNATWNGDAMTSLGVGSGSFSGGIVYTFGIFKINSPSTGTVTVNWLGNVTHKVIHAFVFDGVNQANQFTTETLISSIVTNNELTVQVDAQYQIPLTSTFTQTTSHILNPGQVQIFNTTNTIGNDSSSYYSMSTVRLDVGIADLPFANSDNTWLTNTTTGAFTSIVSSDTSFMINADNGYSYLFADNHIHKIDGREIGGTNGTVTEDVIVFPSYFSIVDAVDTRGKMYTAVQANPVAGYSDYRTYSEQVCGVYVWDRQSTVFGMRDFLPLEGVRDIKKIYVAPNGDVRIICIGDDRFTQIRSLAKNGEVIATLGLKSYPEYRDSLKIINGGVVWLGSDGIFYWHGKINQTEEIYKIGNITNQYTGTLAAGSIIVGHTESTQSRQGITFSLTDGSTQKARKWYPHATGTIATAAQTAYSGDVYTLLKFLPELSTINHINIICRKGTTSDTTAVASLKLYANQSTTAFATKTITKADIAKGFIPFEINKPYVTSLQFEIEWAANTLGADDFCPIYATVNYTPTTTIK